MTDGVTKVDTGPKLGIRHIQVILTSLLIVVAYASRINLSVAVVAMTSEKSSPNPEMPVYNWDNKSVVLSSFFWGYICLQLFAGSLGRAYGTKNILIPIMFIDATACVLIPTMAELLGAWGVMGCRFLQGLAQGFIFPSVHNILGQWAPPAERARMASITFAGGGVGIIISMTLSGLLCSTWVGWPSTFYLFGSCGYLWVVLFFFYGADYPSQHKSISIAERSYIESSIGFDDKVQSMKTPWMAMLKSWPVWAVIVANCGQNWGFSTLITELPNYLDKVMKFNINANGVLSALPYVVNLMVTLAIGVIGDYTVNHRYMSVGAARKLFTTIGCVCAAAGLLVVGYLPESAIIASVATLVLSIGLTAVVFAGMQINHIDISPNFSGILMGTANGTSSFLSILAPLFVQWVVTVETDKSLWRIVFITSAAIYLASNVFFVIFASGEVQWWNFPIKENALDVVEGNAENLLKLQKASKSVG